MARFLKSLDFSHLYNFYDFIRRWRWKIYPSASQNPQSDYCNFYLRYEFLAFSIKLALKLLPNLPKNHPVNRLRHLSQKPLQSRTLQRLLSQLPRKRQKNHRKSNNWRTKPRWKKTLNSQIQLKNQSCLSSFSCDGCYWNRHWYVIDEWIAGRHFEELKSYGMKTLKNK